MSDTNAVFISDVHQMTADLATMKTTIANVQANQQALKDKITALTASGQIPADVAAELHAAVADIAADNTTLQGLSDTVSGVATVSGAPANDQGALNPSDPNAA